MYYVSGMVLGVRGTVMKEIVQTQALLSNSLQLTRNMCINLLITRVMAVIKGEI